MEQVDDVHGLPRTSRAVAIIDLSCRVFGYLNADLVSLTFGRWVFSLGNEKDHKGRQHPIYAQQLLESIVKIAFFVIAVVHGWLFFGQKLRHHPFHDPGVYVECFRHE